MKLFCHGLDLSEAIIKVIKATSSKTTNPILEGIKITAKDNTLILTATDGELAIEKAIIADVKIEGETVVPGKFFNEYIRKLVDQEIEIDLIGNNQLKIKYTDSEVFVSCLDPQEFPKIKEVNDKKYFELSKKQFKDIVNKTIISVSSEDTRPILKGAMFEIENNDLKVVSLDGYRLSLVNSKINESKIEEKIIIPGRSLSEMSKLLEEDDENIKIFIQDNYVMIETDSTKVITRLFDGNFPDYKIFIEEKFESVITINKEQLEETLERASILARVSNDNSVIMTIKENNLKVRADSEIGKVEENIAVVLEGKDIEIRFDARFIKDCLRVSSDEFIKLCLNSSSKPAIIKPNDKTNYLFLVIPLRTV